MGREKRSSQTDFVFVDALDFLNAGHRVLFVDSATAVLAFILLLLAVSAEAQVLEPRRQWSLPNSPAIQILPGSICDWCKCCKVVNRRSLGFSSPGNTNRPVILEQRMFDALKAMRQRGVSESTVNSVLRNLGRTGLEDFCDECRCCTVKRRSVEIKPPLRARPHFRKRYYILER